MAGKAHGTLTIFNMAQADVAKYDRQELSDYLLSSGIRQEVAEVFQANMINGNAFLSLSEDDLKELLPVIGNRSLVRKLLKKLRKVYNAIIIYYVTYTVRGFRRFSFAVS